MKIGDLRHRIDLQSYTDYIDIYGKPDRSWTTYATVWAQITPTSNSESIYGLQLSSSTTHAILIRYQPDVAPNHRVLFGSRIFNIEGVRNLDEAQIATALVCQEAITLTSGIPS
jgi:SPP1 family predicted phage head-tail adaptor